MKDLIVARDLDRFQQAFASDPRNRLAMNAVTQSGPTAVGINRQALVQTNHTFSHVVETPDITNQKGSGRCWLFAGLNVLRLAAMKKMGLDQFELSQTYLMFWDKLEKANFFLENIIETRNEPLNGRLVMWLLQDPIGDGGQWDMFVNLIAKYGAVPKMAMPESYGSSSSRGMNAPLVAKLREYASRLRDAHAQNLAVEELRQLKGQMMSEYYRMLTIHLGEPPKTFDWSWRDKDKVFHRHGAITPQDFFQQYVGIDLDDYVCLINAPTADKPYERMYTVQYLGNVVGGLPVRYLNVDIETLKAAAVATLKEGEAVWFGCDVGKSLERSQGILDLDIYDDEALYGTTLQLDKAQRLDYGHSQMTHAMVFAGVDLDEDDTPRKWKVENSWGKESGHDGFLVMTDAWFDEFLYEIAISKRFLSPKLLAVLDTEPIVLPPWDPMGSLASSEF